MTEKDTEIVVKKLLNDKRKLYDIHYTEYLGDLGIEGDSFKSISDFIDEITSSSFYNSSKARIKDNNDAIIIAIKCFFVFPLLNFTFVQDFNKINTTPSCGSQNGLTQLFIKRGIRYVTQGDDSDDIEVKEEFDKFLHAVMNGYKSLPRTQEAHKFKKHILTLFECCYTVSPSWAKATEEEGVIAFYQYHLRALETIFTFVDVSTTSVEFGNKISVPVPVNLGENPKRIQIRPDITVSTNQGQELLIPMEFKKYNAKTMFESLLDPQKSEENHLLNQVLLYMLSTESEIGFLSDGYTIARLRIDLTKLVLGKVGTKMPNSLTVPLKIHMFNTKTSGCTAMIELAAVIAKTMKELENGSLEEVKSKVRRYKDVLTKSPKEMCQQLRERAERLIEDGTWESPSSVMFEDVEYLGRYQEIQVGFHFNAQTLAFDMRDLQNILKFEPSAALEANEREPVIIKIYDPIRRLYVENLDKYFPFQIIESMEEPQKNELLIYRRIQEFNETSEKKVNIAKIYKEGHIKLSLSKDFYAGPFIVFEKLLGKPTLMEHFVKGKEQLDLLHRAGIYHGDIKLSNVFFHKHNFVFIDFGFSILERRSEYQMMSIGDKRRMDLEAFDLMEREVLGN